MGKRLDYALTAEQLGELEQAINCSPYPEVRNVPSPFGYCIWVSRPNRWHKP